MTTAEVTALYQRIARLERILDQVLDNRRENAINEVAVIEKAMGKTRTIPNRAQRKAEAYELKQQG
jgi:hypothetical protein